MANDLHQVLHLPSCIVWEFAYDCGDQNRQSWNQILHFLAPIVKSLKDRLTQKLVCRLQLLCICNEDWVNLESVAQIICNILLYNLIQSWCELLLHCIESLTILSWEAKSQSRCLKQDVWVVGTCWAILDRFSDKAWQNLTKSAWEWNNLRLRKLDYS